MLGCERLCDFAAVSVSREFLFSAQSLLAAWSLAQGVEGALPRPWQSKPDDFEVVESSESAFIDLEASRKNYVVSRRTAFYHQQSQPDMHNRKQKHRKTLLLMPFHPTSTTPTPLFLAHQAFFLLSHLTTAGLIGCENKLL